MELVIENKQIFIVEDECIFRILKFKSGDEYTVIIEDEYEGTTEIEVTNKEGLKKYSVNMEKLLLETWGT